MILETVHGCCQPHQSDIADLLSSLEMLQHSSHLTVALGEVYKANRTCELYGMLGKSQG